MNTNLKNEETKWKIRALIFGLVFSVIGNVISIPKAFLEWKSSKIEVQQSKLDIERLEKQKEALSAEIRQLKYDTAELSSLIDIKLQSWNKETIASFEAELSDASAKAIAIREKANGEIESINHRIRTEIIEKQKAGLIVGAIHLLAYDTELGANRAVTKKQLSDGVFSHVRYEALVNSKRVKKGDIVYGLSISSIDEEGVTFSISPPEYHSAISFIIQPTPALMPLEFDDYLRRFPELRVK